MASGSGASAVGATTVRRLLCRPATTAERTDDDEKSAKASSSPSSSSASSAFIPAVVPNFDESQLASPVWGTTPHQTWILRHGPNYSSLKRKGRSKEALYQPFACDVFRSQSKLTRITCSATPAAKQADIDAIYGQLAMHALQDARDELALIADDDKAKKRVSLRIKELERAAREEGDGRASAALARIHPDVRLPPTLVVNWMFPDYSPPNALWGKTKDDGVGVNLVMHFVLSPKLRDALASISDDCIGKSSPPPMSLSTPLTSATTADAVDVVGRHTRRETINPTSASSRDLRVMNALQYATPGKEEEAVLEEGLEDPDPESSASSPVISAREAGARKGTVGNLPASVDTPLARAAAEGYGINLAAVCLTKAYLSHDEATAGRFCKRLKAIARVANLQEAELATAVRKLCERYNATPFLIIKPLVRHCPAAATEYKAAGCDAVGRMQVTPVELDIDVHRFSYLVRVTLKQLKSKLRNLVFDVGIVVQGNADDELPECILGSMRMASVRYQKGSCAEWPG